MITVAISGHRRRLRMAVHAAALLLWALAEAALLASVVDAPRSGPIALLAVWTLAGAALLWNGIRRSAGRETLTVTPRLLVLRRGLGPFHLTRRFDLERIDRVHAVRLPGLTSDRHVIEFTCDGRTRRFGRNLSAREAACIVNLIRRSADDLRLLF